jgi:hypothetical protein
MARLQAYRKYGNIIAPLTQGEVSKQPDGFFSQPLYLCRKERRINAALAAEVRSFA